MSRRNTWQRRGFGTAIAAVGAVAALGSIAPRVGAHGAEIRLERIRAYTLEATYDSGEPMAGAQVSVFHSDDPRTAVLTATTDEAGRWLWVADRPGTWTFQVRQAGHGSVTRLEVSPQEAAEPHDSAFETTAARTASAAALPRWIALGSVIWGAIGTALFFARSAERPQPPRSQNGSVS